MAHQPMNNYGFNPVTCTVVQIFSMKCKGWWYRHLDFIVKTPQYKKRQISIKKQINTNSWCWGYKISILAFPR